MTSNVPSNCVLITGAAKRIGRALALDFARTGWDVAIHYHSSADDAETLVDEIEALGQRAVALRCNLSDLKAVEQLVPFQQRPPLAPAPRESGRGKPADFPGYPGHSGFPPPRAGL